MSVTGLAVFDETVQKTNTWLKDISETLHCDRHRAYQALRGVLHCLRDRLTVDEAAHLGGQLPMLVRGVYYEGWRPAGKPEKVRSYEDFLFRVAAHLTNTPIEPQSAVRVVFEVLESHVSRGEIEDILRQLPHDIRALWPQAKLREHTPL